MGERHRNGASDVRDAPEPAGTSVRAVHAGPIDARYLVVLADVDVYEPVRAIAACERETFQAEEKG